MTQIHFTLNFEEMTKEILNCNLNHVIKSQLITIMNAYMEAERDKLVNANLKEKTENRHAVRNGYYDRQLTLPIGTIELKVPRTRDGEFSTELFEKYSRMDQSLVLMMIESVVNGVSTRKVTKLVEALAGKQVSKSLVSNIIKKLDPEIKEWSERSLTKHTYQYLYVDAMIIKVRENKKIVSKSVYIAQAVNQLNKRELVGFKISETESEKAWSDFFSDLRNRGFSDPELIISDAHQGLKNAIDKQFKGVPWQRCCVHFIRNIIDVMPKKHSEEARHLLRNIFKAPTIQHAIELKSEFINLVEDNPKYEAAINKLDDGFDEATQFYQFPATHHVHIRTTNSIENINMQIRRRERVIRIFPNPDSAFRLIGAVLLDMSENLDIKTNFLK